MRRLRLGTAGFVLAMLLVVPRAASAGMGDIIDVIIGLTGPQMIGAPIACEVNIPSKETACYFAGASILKAWRVGAFDEFWRSQRLWVSLGGGAYVSTGKDSEMREFEVGDVRMLAFEPTLNYRFFPRTGGNFAIEHGAGLSYFVLFGDRFKSFDNTGIKATPVALTWRNISDTQIDFGVAYNLRLFPSAFTAEQFGAPAASTTHEGREVVHGFAIKVGF